MKSEERTINFLVAPDKFKGTLTARQVSKNISQVLISRYPSASIAQVPIADGGDGSLEILLDNDYTPVKVETFNALMEPIQAIYGLKNVGGRSIAFLEMASICGIASLKGRDLQPHFASSYGLGDVAHQVLTSGVDEIIVSVGGSASTDGGIGFLVGLGAVIKDAAGSRVSPNLTGLKSAETIDLSLLHPRIHPLFSDVKWTFLVDVSNPLVGENGAAFVFGPQKGLQEDELVKADEALRHWAKLLHRATGVDVSLMQGTGAAGGVASIAQSIFAADFLPGAQWFANHLNLEQKIKNADVVITGEGSFDSQSLMGKGPGYVLQESLKNGKKTIVLAGKIEVGLKGLERTICQSLVEISGDTRMAMANPSKWLIEATEKALDFLDATS